MFLSTRANLAIAGFFLTASMLAGGCIPQDTEQDAVSFVDDNGENVTVTKNEDGTETATYDDGRSVTFRRDDNGNITPVSGMTSLLAGLAAGYLLSRGFSGGTGYFDTSRNMYRATTPYTYNQSQDRSYSRNNGISKSRVSDNPSNNATVNNNAGTAATQKANTGTTAKSATTAGGFGGAGARSAAA